MRKKFLPLIMAAIMLIMGLGITDTTEVAADTDTFSVPITKTLTATGLEDTIFYFTVSEEGVTDAALGTIQPEIDGFTITVEKGKTEGTYNIVLPTYTSVGIYTYKINETKGSIAGVTYSEAELYLVVTVTNDGSGGYIRTAGLHVGSTGGPKNTTEYKNTYEAGTLTVTKYVTGNLGDATKEFDVTVTFTKDADVTVNSTISYTIDGVPYSIAPTVWDNSNSYEVEFKVKHNSTVTFENIPYGISYEVKESDYSTDGYKTYINDTEASSSGVCEMDSSTEEVKITNQKNDSSIDTGVILDSLPYILILAVVLLGVVYLVIRRRSSNLD